MVSPTYNVTLSPTEMHFNTEIESMLIIEEVY